MKSKIVTIAAAVVILFSASTSFASTSSSNVLKAQQFHEVTPVTEITPVTHHSHSHRPLMATVTDSTGTHTFEVAYWLNGKAVAR